MRFLAIGLFALMSFFTECGGDDHGHDHEHGEEGAHDHEHGDDHAHE